MTDTFGSTLRHTLGVGDAVVVGLGSRVGAGVFAALAPAAHAAGSGLLLGLTAAAVVAYCNAMSSARLAVLHSFGVLTYYAVANASAWTLDSWPTTRVVPVVGLAGCLVLAFSRRGSRWPWARRCWWRGWWLTPCVGVGGGR